MGEGVRNEITVCSKAPFNLTQEDRIEKENRVILQFEQPLRKFLIGEVSGPYQYAEVEDDDFNHILPCKPLTPNFIDIESSIISRSLRYDLSKRGHYYEIYPEESI